jgi:signal recognition particle subunit SRP14
MAPFMRKRDKKKEKAKAEAAAKKKKELYADVTLGSAGKRGKGRRQRVSKASLLRYVIMSRV